MIAVAIFASSSTTSQSPSRRATHLRRHRDNDTDFVNSGYLQNIAWLKNDSGTFIEYGDVIRVAGLVGFHRGRAAAIVSELSGRDPDTRKVDGPESPLPTTPSKQHCIRS